MQPIGFHINMKLADGRVLAPGAAARRVVARAVLRACAGERLLAFRGADSHLHLELACDRERAGRLAQRVGSSLKQRLGSPVPFQSAWFEPLANQRHAYRAFDYILDQELRHGIAADPWYEVSNLPDLLGLRWLGAYTVGHVRALLPRVSIRELRARFERIVLPLPGSDAEQLAEAAAAAFAIPEWRGRSATVEQAPCAAEHAASTDVSAAPLGAALGTTHRAIARLRGKEPRPGSVKLVQGQLAIRQAAAVRHSAQTAAHAAERAPAA